MGKVKDIMIDDSGCYANSTTLAENILMFDNVTTSYSMQDIIEDVVKHQYISSVFLNELYRDYFYNHFYEWIGYK